MRKLAIISPSANVLTETFIEAHKDLLSGEKKIYFGGALPTFLEGYGNLWSTGLTRRMLLKLVNRIDNNLSLQERAFMHSLKKERVEVVLAEYGISGAAVTAACKSAKIPLVVHFHGYDAHNRDFTDPLANAYKKMFDYASAIISVSDFMTKRLCELGCPPEKIIYDPYGPGETFFEVVTDYTSNQFLSVGRFVDKKAPYLMLIAFKELLKKHSTARLVMAGDGPLLNSCKNMAKVWDMDKNVVFPGAIKHKEVMRLMGESFCFVQHSITAENGDSEGSPVGILEAGAAGLPIVATRHAGIRETVLDGKSGFLVDELDTKDMATRMAQLFANRKTAKAMGLAGQAHIRENFSMEKHIKCLDKVLAGLG